MFCKWQPGLDCDWQDAIWWRNMTRYCQLNCFTVPYHCFSLSQPYKAENHIYIQRFEITKDDIGRQFTKSDDENTCAMTVRRRASWTSSCRFCSSSMRLRCSRRSLCCRNKCAWNSRIGGMRILKSKTRSIYWWSLCWHSIKRPISVFKGAVNTVVLS